MTTANNERSLVTWALVSKMMRTPFFHYSPYVVIGVPFIALFYDKFIRPIFHSQFPSLLVIGFTAAMLFVFAEVVFYFGCPEIVRNYRTENEYEKEEKSSYLESQQHQRLNVVLTNLERSEADIRSRLETLKRSDDQAALNGELDVLYPMVVGRYLRKQYNCESKQDGFAAWTAAILYVIGFALALWVMGGRVVEVYEAFGKR